MNLNLKNKTALVCGGSSEIGFATAKELAQLGVKIILLARTESTLKEKLVAINAINQLTNQYITVDVSDTAHLREKVATVVAKEPIHILINNSGGSPASILATTKDKELETAFRQHVISAQVLSHLVIPNMKAVGYGRIVNIISTSVRQPTPGLAISNTIRGAVASWAKGLSNELAASQITVNNVLPGTTDTPMIQKIIYNRAQKLNISEKEVINKLVQKIPMHRMGTAEEVAALVAFLASPAASYITGTSIPVDGGKIKAI